jgi:diguanylate cyclase (GGDEF)-like protein
MANFFDDVTAARSNVLDRLSSGQPVDPAEREQLDQISAGRQSQFRNGLRRAAYNASATSRAFVGQMAEPFAPEFAERQFEDAERISRTQPEYLRPEVESFRDVTDLPTAVSYASGALGEGVASVGTMVAAGLAARLGLGGAARAVGRRMSAGALNAAQYAGGMAAMLPQEGGETALGLRQNPTAMANTTPAERAALTLGRGTVNAALENIVPQLVFTNAITGAAGRIAPGAASALTNVARKGAAGVVGEGATEAAQEFTGQAAENIAAPGTGYDPEPALEAAVRGAITGGVLGGAGGTIQAVRSGITDATERAQEAAANVDTDDLLNRTVENIDRVVRNPEEFGEDLTNATLGSLAAAQERATELGRTAEERAAPAVASGMDAVAELRRRLDVGIAQRLTPENVDKYAELTKNLRLMSGVEYKILTDALRTNDPDEINRAVGTVSRVFARRVPRETMRGVKSFGSWVKRFGAGVTNAARERRAAVVQYRPEAMVEYARYLRENNPDIANFLIDSQAPEERTAAIRTLMAVRDGRETPKQQDQLMEIGRQIGVDPREFLDVIRGTAPTRTVTRERQPAPATLTPEEEAGVASLRDSSRRIMESADQFYTDAVRTAMEENDINWEERAGVSYAEDGTVYDANGNPMDPEEVDTTPYTSRELVQRIQSSATYNGRPTVGADRPAFNIPVTYESADGRATPAQIARLLGAEDVVQNPDRSYTRTRRDPTDEEIAPRIKDEKLEGFLSPVALAANTGKPEDAGGFKETFSRFVPDFENTNRDVGVQAYRLLSALSALDTDGIELAPDQIPQEMWAELGITKDSEPLKITANVEAGALDLNTVVSRQKIGGKTRNVTMGDLLGVNRGKRRLESQLELMQSIARSGENVNVSQVLNQMVDREGDITADAALSGLKKFAKANKLSPNAAVPGYMEQLERRFNDTDRKLRFSQAMNGLRRAYQDEVVSLDELDELRTYKSLEDESTDERLDDFAAYLQSDMEVDWKTDEELVDMLDAFFDDVVPQIDMQNRDIIENSTEAGEEPTPDDFFDAFRRRSPEGRETASRVEGRDITQQRDEGAGPGPRQRGDVDRIAEQRGAADETIGEDEIVSQSRLPFEGEGELTADQMAATQARANRSRRARPLPRTRMVGRRPEPAPAPEPVPDSPGADELQDALTKVDTVVDLDELQATLMSAIEGAAVPDSVLKEADAIFAARRAELEATEFTGYAKRLADGTEFLGPRKRLSKLVKNFADKYLDGAEVRVVEYDPRDPEVQEYFRAYDEVPLGRAVPPGSFGPDSPAMILIKRNTSTLASKRYGQLNTLAHEFGHIVDYVAYRNAPQEVKDSIERAYQRDIQAAVDVGNMGQALFRAGSVLRYIPQRNVQAELTNPDATLEAGRDSVRAGIYERIERGESMYLLSKSEYFAEQFSKYVMREPNVFAEEGSTVRTYLDGVIAKIAAFYREVIQKLSPTPPEFDAFMEWLGTPAAERPPLPAQTSAADAPTPNVPRETTPPQRQGETANARMIRERREQRQAATTPAPTSVPPQSAGDWEAQIRAATTVPGVGRALRNAPADQRTALTQVANERIAEIQGVSSAEAAAPEFTPLWEGETPTMAPENVAVMSAERERRLRDSVLEMENQIPEQTERVERDDDQRRLYEARLDEMTPEEAQQTLDDLRTTINTDERTGLGTNRKWIRTPKKRHIVSIDLDNLKTVNDNMGHGAGDQMLALMGEALRSVGLGNDAFHISGDEFYVHGNNINTLQRQLRQAQQYLDGQRIEGEGFVFTGPRFSFGVGRTLDSAEAALGENKAAREASGERTARGEIPERMQRVEEMAQEPPQGPPSEPPQGNEPPPPPPDNAARERFIATVKRLLGDRVRVVFDQELPKGLAALYENEFNIDVAGTREALKTIRDRLRVERGVREAKRDGVEDEGNADPRSIAEITAAIGRLEQKEQEYLADLAVRGTIRVATGMESQAGLAEHEALHAAFEFFFDDNAKEERRIITTAFSRGLLSRRLRSYFAGQEAVLNVIDPTSKDFNAEEAAAYAFQVYVHDPGALQMGQQVEGIFNKILAYLQRLVGYTTYEQRAKMVFDDLQSGRRAERNLSVFQQMENVDLSVREQGQEFVRNLGSGIMRVYDTVFTSAYDRLDKSGNVAMAQIARLGYNETGQEGQGMLQLQRQETVKWSNRMKEALHMLNEAELAELNRLMQLGEDATGKLRKPQERLRQIFKDVHKYQLDAGVELGFQDNYFPLIWSPEKVKANYNGFVEMLSKPEYAEFFDESMKTPTEIADDIVGYISRGHEFQGVFNREGEPTADSSRRRALDFITPEDRLAFMEDDLVTTIAHYLNQSVRHAEYVRAFGPNSERLKQLMNDVTNVYGGTGTDRDLVVDYIDGLMGNKEAGMSRELKDVYGAMVTYQNVRLLPLSIFSSFVDPLGTAIRTNNMGAAFDGFAYSIKNLFTDFRKEWTPDKWERFAEDMGTIDMSGTVKAIDKIYTGVTLRGKTRTINDTFFKYNLLNGWVKNNTIAATKAAQLFLRRSADGTIHGDQRDVENLQEVGVTREDIVFDENLGRIRATVPEILGVQDMDAVRDQFDAEQIQAATEQAERIQRAVNKIVRQSMIQPSSAEMPGWMSNPYLAPIAHLKTFVFGFNATILQRLMYEAQRGNYSPLYYAAAYVPGMIAADFIKGLAGNGGEEPEWKKNWTLGDYVIHGVNRSGLTGTGQFFTDMGNDIVRGGGGFESLAGPSVEQGLDFLGAMKAKTSRPAQTWMVNALPANDLYDQWMR